MKIMYERKMDESHTIEQTYVLARSELIDDVSRSAVPSCK